MSLELEPAELGFKRPFTQEVSQVLRLHNPSGEPVAFKVKTTAPKQYCVRPNSGRIDGGKDVEVQVLLQAMKEDPPPDVKCRDKFLVQSVTIKADTDSNVSQIWSNIEQNAKSSIQEKKIRVNFLPADGSGGAGLSSTTAAAVAAGAGGAATAAAVTTNGVTNHEDDTRDTLSPSPPATTPQRSSGAADRSALDATNSSTLAAATSVIPTSQEELKQQLEDAKATIARLQGQISDGIRQRKPQEAAEKAINSVQQSLQNAPAPGGVPVQVVAGLCLLTFLIAWLFF